MECAWGQVVVVRADGSAACMRERDLGAKLDALYAKSLYPVALNLATDEEVRLFFLLWYFGTQSRYTRWR